MSTHRLLIDPYAPEFEMEPQYSGYYDMISGFPFVGLGGYGLL